MTQIELDITKVIGGGRGMAHHQDEVWMVSGALSGERVRAESLGRKHGIIEGKTLEVLSTPHAAREPDPCPHAPQCGGCDWPHIIPEAATALKPEIAAESARGLPELSRLLREAPIKASPMAYRLRARLHWDPDQKILGFYRPRSNTVETILQCRILSPRLVSALPSLTEAFARTCPHPVDLEWLENLDGSQAVAAIRKASRGPDVPLSAVPAADTLDNGPDGFHLLEASDTLKRVWGRDHVRMALPTPLEVPIGAFFQGNRHLVPWLFQRVTELIGPEPVPTFDLFAGVGFLAAAANHASERPLVLAETCRSSGRAAQRNLPNAAVRFGRSAEETLRRSGRIPKNTLAIVDPPRAGLSKDLRRRLAAWHPDRLLMLACDPATWARDTADLMDKGYRLTHLELIDLFPSTHHVEVLSVLEASDSTSSKGKTRDQGSGEDRVGE
jgi:23S rRNA (uracil1939-C5)-methyltransferase